MKDRIKQYMDYKSISAGELSSRLDVQRSNISHILNGRNKPGASFIEKLLVSFPDLNARWLLTGSGEMVENNDFEEQGNCVKVDSETYLNKPQITNPPVTEQDKPIDKIVLLFSDGTFTDFKKK